MVEPKFSQHLLGDAGNHPVVDCWLIVGWIGEWMVEPKFSQHPLGDAGNHLVVDCWLIVG